MWRESKYKYLNPIQQSSQMLPDIAWKIERIGH